MDTTEQTCEQRIAAHLKGREDDVDLLMRCGNITNDGIPASADIIDKLTDLGVDMSADTGEEWEESAREALDNLPLEISTTTTLKVLLSTGGPADYLTAEIDEEDGGYMRAAAVVYHFADWFDHAESALSDDSPLVTWFDSIVETYAASS